MKKQINYNSKMRQKAFENLIKVKNKYPDSQFEEDVYRTLNNYFRPNMYPQAAIKDVVTLYYLLWDNYRVKGGQIYLLEANAEASYLYLNLAVKYYAKAYNAFLSGCISFNPAINNQLQNIEAHENFLYHAIALNELEIAKRYSSICPVISLVLASEYDKARTFLEDLDIKTDDSQEPFYIHISFLKDIYLAMLDRNEDKFNELLSKRISKYRRRPASYQPYVDTTSVALIKMAKKLGVQCKFSVEEIPEYFLTTRASIKNADCCIMDLQKCERAFKEWGGHIPNLDEIKSRLF